MPLPAGTRLGPYEIVMPVGAGGMGEVYQAKDTRLDRTVAIKVLLSHLASDADRRQRFEREARAVSGLNHPHICTLHDIGHQEGIDFLVMEYLEGETLDHRLTKGPLPADQVLRYAVEIADALDKAHRRGIIHRDLKPGNIMLTKSGAKLLDFGLAKLRQPESDPVSANLSALPTEAGRTLTGEGTILGTFQYMAPEQLEGKDADARTDIFAFGAVVYEMATGKKAFEGKSHASLIAAILSSEPQPISKLQPMAPPALDRVVKMCLAKDPDERWQSAHDLGNELKWTAEGSNQPGLVESIGAVTVRERTRRTRERLAWGAAVVLLLGLAAVSAVGYFQRVPKPDRAMYFSGGPPIVSRESAISPDGQLLAFVAYGDKVGRNVLWIHPIGSRTGQWSDTTAGATYPFWSPDSRYVGFFADGKLKKIDASGGSAEALCNAPYGRGGAWSQDGIIVFAPDVFTGLYRVAASGAAAVPLTQNDPSRGETSHRWPSFLPDGRHFLYLAASFSGAHNEVNAIYLGCLDSKERQLIVRADANAAYAPPGYLLYLRGGSLVAQPFDAKRFRLSGDATSIAEQVAYLPQVDYAIFSASENVVVYQSGSGTILCQLTWFSRTGKRLDSLGPPRVYANPHISPDGKRIAADLTDLQAQAANADIWIYELINGAPTRLTFDPSLDRTPIWSPDGTRIVFSSNRNGAWQLYQKLSNGAGADELLLESSATLALPCGWSRDGRFLIYQTWDSKSGQDLWILAMTGEKKTFPLVQTKSDEMNGQFSPDGRWVAYASNESGKWQVYVTSFPGAVGKWQISTGGGSQPRWRGDGKELFYLASDNKLMAVQVKPRSTFEASVATPLFQARPREAIGSADLYSYDVSPDGQRFLINMEAEQAKAPPISVILNWTAGLKQ